MIKNIIRQIAPEHQNWEWYFDGDCFNENSGDYFNTIFGLFLDRWKMHPCINKKEYESVHSEMCNVFYAIGNELGYSYKNIKEIMEDYKLSYSPHRARKLKELAESNDEESEVLAEYLTLKTYKQWKVASACGYCQGDYAEVIYCTDNYTEKNAHIFAEAILGCGNEYMVIYLNDNGDEEETVSGFFVTDSEAWRDEDVKALICKWECLNPEETRLEMIDGSHTYTEYTYRAV